MTADFRNDEDCSEHRATILDRAKSNDDEELGMIWIDDSIGLILAALDANNQLENTFFLFQMDHGQEGKGSLNEPGLRTNIDSEKYQAILNRLECLKHITNSGDTPDYTTTSCWGGDEACLDDQGQFQHMSKTRAKKTNPLSRAHAVLFMVNTALSHAIFASRAVTIAYVAGY